MKNNIKKLTFWIILLVFAVFMIWLFAENAENVQAQYGNMNLKNVTAWSSGWYILDGNMGI